MARVIVVDNDNKISSYLINRLNESSMVEECQIAPGLNGDFTSLLAEGAIDTIIYSPQLQPNKGMSPDLAEAETVLEGCTHAGIQKVVLLSSAAIYGASPYNPGLISESRSLSLKGNNPIGVHWIEFETLAEKYLRKLTDGKDAIAPLRLTILRPSAVPTRGGTDYFSQLFSRRLAFTLPLHDPSIQLLSPDDLANAVCCAVEKSDGGVFNVAPDSVIPLRIALRMAGSNRIPVPRPLKNDQLEYIHYSWTVSGEKIERELGFVPKRSSAEALADFLGSESDSVSGQSGERLEFDDFGLDTNYIDAKGRGILKFLHNSYFRTEVKGIEYVPREGRAILTGVHRGFMPFDGVLMVHLIAQEVGRYIRTLIHPALVKTPFPFNFEKLGGINACRENADYVLQQDELLSWFPEGIQGAFRYYRNVYQLGKFGRDEYVKAALRNRAPIVPFVTVGSAEIFPVLAKIQWRWLKRLTLWPCFPIAPPFPLLSFPFPAKWHTQFLEPIHVEKQYPPEAADDIATVQAISQEVKNRMQEAIDNMLRQRKHIFFGSIFSGEES